MSDRISFDLTALDKLIQEYPRLGDLLLDEFKTAMPKSLAMFQEQVQGFTPVGVTGNLRQSFLPYYDYPSSGLNIEGQLASNLVYGWPVERGRRPGKMPPLEAIELWVRRKLGVSEDEVESATYAIARTIALRGTSGAAMVAKGFEAAEQPVTNEWLKAMVLAIVKFARELDHI